MSTAPPLPVLKESDGGSTVREAFDELQHDLQIEQWKSAASKQQQRLRERLDSRLSLLASYITGSYRRNTQIFPLDDIDVLLVLNPDEYGDILADPYTGVVTLLDILQAALRDAYPKSEIERHDRCIRIQFAGTGIGFDVIPSFRQSEDVFLIPDERLRRLLPTNPKEHERVISEANAACDGMLVPLVKLSKAVNEQLGKPLSGFHVEMMAYYALKSVPPSYQHGVTYLLAEFASRIWLAVPDPWPLGLNADEYLTWERRGETAAAFRFVADVAGAAVQAEQDEDVDEAHRLWAQVFGDLYPVTPPAKQLSARLTPVEAARAVSRGVRVSATSSGLVAVTAGFRSAKTSTSHGGRAPHRTLKWSGVAPDVEWHERQIARVLHQFSGLRRLTPAEAAADPAIWPVQVDDIETLYAVLIGDQCTNLGVRHRLAVVIPKDAPAVEPAVYDLRPYRPAQPRRGGWKPKHGLLHHWGGGVLCTHAARDRWEGQLATLIIWSVDWLFRQDYHQRFGRWLGPEIDGHGRLRVNGVVQQTDARLVRHGYRGMRVPV